MTTLRTTLVSCALALVAAGCGSDGVPSGGASVPESSGPGAASWGDLPDTMPTAPHYNPELVVTTGYPVTVIEGPNQPAELCLGGVAQSYPPQCGGPRLVDFDWEDHAGDFEQAVGVKFGDFLVEGRYDGKLFTVTKVVPGDEFVDPDEDRADLDLDERFQTPCPAPAGGWRVLDESKTTEETQERTFIAAEKLPGYADSWVDQSRNPMDGRDAVTIDDEYAMNDPKLLTINVRVTHDLAGAEAALRKIWGGALCVSSAERTDKEMRAIQNRMNDLPGMTQSSVADGVVVVSVQYDDGFLQAWADREYGPGMVEVYSELEPV